MTSLVDEVARAIDPLAYGAGGEQEARRRKPLALERSRAAIRVIAGRLREPSEEAIAACEAALDEAYNGNKDDPGCSYGIKKVARALADHLEGKG